MPDPQLARGWPKIAPTALHLGAVDVAYVLKPHTDKAMELAFGVEYCQAIEQDAASPEAPEDPNDE